MRKPGWYWVKVIDGGKWGCFLWNGSAWEGESDRYSDEMFDVVGPRIPTPDEMGSWRVVPKEITAETGHKAGMMSEFSQSIPLMCEACAGDGEDEHDDSGVCSECDGAGEYGLNVNISWTTIKAIHRRIVEIAEGRE